MSNKFTIIKMVEEGKLTAEQGLELLDKLTLSENIETGPISIRFVRIILRDTNTSETLIDNSIPVFLAKMGIQVMEKIWNDAAIRRSDIAHFKINFQQVYARLEKNEQGKVLELTSQDGSRKLEVRLE